MVSNEDYHRKALLLSYFTVGYNVLEGVISILAGLVAGSIALVGFGLDSFVESLSGGVMIWRFRKHGVVSEEEEEAVEAKATRLVGYTFFILAAYVLYESAEKLISREAAQPSIVGIVIALLSIIIMPFLARMKYNVGKAIHSRSLEADSKETLACVFMSFALLVGLATNYLWGLWQADPITGIVIAAFLIKEGYETLTEDDE